jgi:uncharacterized protein YjaG (DUF416 family)
VIGFDRQSLVARLEKLSAPWRTLFALSCAERLFPLYKAFSEKTMQGAPIGLRSTLDDLWESVAKGLTGVKQPFLDEYESLIPSDDVERTDRTRLDALADDAVAALAYTCQCQLTGETQNAVWAAERDYEAVDYIAHTLGGIDFKGPEEEEAILRTEYVQAELHHQLRDLTELEQAARDEENPELVVERLRFRAKFEGMTLTPLAYRLLLINR